MSIQRNPGGYAVLLGAGVSIASGAPSAWDVQMSLVRQIASAKGADAGPRTEEWFAERFGTESTHDGPLERLRTTQGVMKTGLREVGLRALDDIVENGYNGWHDSIAERMTTSRLEVLRDRGEYDRAVVLAHA